MTAGRFAAGLLALLMVAALGGTVRAAQDQADASDDALVDRLVAIEDRASGVPFLPQVTVSDDESFGTLSGDFVGARVTLDQLDDDLGALVANAADASGEVADAVAAVTSAYRTMLEGYTFLEAYERSLLVAPDGDVEDGGDEARGPAENGLVLLLDALADFHDGYRVLRDTEAAAEVRSLFELRFEEVRTAARTDGQAARLALSLPSTELLVAVDRFDPIGADGDASRTVRYTCVAREDYLATRSADPAEEVTLPEGAREDLLIADCLDLPTDSFVVEEAPAGE